MASAFSLLTSGGARFNPKYQSDVDLFSSRPKGKGKTRTSTAVQAQSDILPSTLDFFGSISNAQAATTLVESEEESSTHGSDSETEAQVYEPKHKITIDGPEPLPRSVTDINDLLHRSPSPSAAYLIRNLRQSGVSSLWGVQCAVAGSFLERRDLLVVAPTGSGKTLSYLLPLFLTMQQPCRSMSGSEAQGIRSVVVVPTYDLAVQIRDVAVSLARGRKWRILLLSKPTEHAVTEACDVDDKDALGVDVLICTPERMHHLVETGSVDLGSVRHLILDEADRLLSDEFHEQTLPILEHSTNVAVQKCFLSATIPSSVEAEAKRHLKDGGTRIIVGVKDAATTNIAQSLLYTGSESGKIIALRRMISTGGLPYPSLIFVQSIERANELYRTLVLDGLLVDVVHGERSKSKREEAIKAFREGNVWVLVVTDVLARGMDFRGVRVVLNYDFPQSVQSYIHRIGRTGRAGRPGQAVTFFSLEDGPHLRTVANVLRASGCEVPEYMLDMPKPSKNMKKKLRSRPVERKQVGGSGRNLAREDAKRRNDIRTGTQRKPTRQGAASEIDINE